MLMEFSNVCLLNNEVNTSFSNEDRLIDQYIWERGIVIGKSKYVDIDINVDINCFFHGKLWRTLWKDII